MSKENTSDRILFTLKTAGSQSAQQIADRFSISLMGAHKALQTLVDAELVSGIDKVGGRGRPKRYFQLTENGHKRFPDNHADLAVEMVNDVKVLFGNTGLDKLIAARENRQFANYSAKIQGDLEERVRQLAALRSEEGYMARVEPTGDESFLLIEDHCPICAAAKVCQGFCRSELLIFQMVLGADIVVERQEHLLSNGRRCAYLIRQAESPVSV